MVGKPLLDQLIQDALQGTLIQRSSKEQANLELALKHPDCPLDTSLRIVFQYMAIYDQVRSFERPETMSMRRRYVTCPYQLSQHISYSYYSILLDRLFGVLTSPALGRNSIPEGLVDAGIPGGIHGAKLAYMWIRELSDSSMSRKIPTATMLRFIFIRHVLSRFYPVWEQQETMAPLKDCGNAIRGFFDGHANNSLLRSAHSGVVLLR